MAMKTVARDRQTNPVFDYYFIAVLTLNAHVNRQNKVKMYRLFHPPGQGLSVISFIKAPGQEASASPQKLCNVHLTILKLIS